MKTIFDRLLKHNVIKLGFSSLLKTENKNRKIFENLFKYSCNNFSNMLQTQLHNNLNTKHNEIWRRK